MMTKFCFLLAGCAAAVSCMAGTNNGAAPSVIYPGEIVVKTPESIAQGKENVRSVADQLRSLFRPLQTVSLFEEAPRTRQRSRKKALAKESV